MRCFHTQWLNDGAPVQSLRPRRAANDFVTSFVLVICTSVILFLTPHPRLGSLYD
jgi:hypothetical protein